MPRRYAAHLAPTPSGYTRSSCASVPAPCLASRSFFFFLNYTPPPEISPFPLPAALPIPGRLTRLRPPPAARRAPRGAAPAGGTPRGARALEVHRADAAQSPVLQDRADAWQPRLPLHLQDRKSTRLNSSHSQISYAVFCLK